MSNSAGTGTTYPDFTLFEASVALTESGLENWEQVVSIIYSQVRIVVLPPFIIYLLLSFFVSFFFVHFRTCTFILLW
jgi:secreted Zn-dependent insulinase-like peptidase